MVSIVSAAAPTSERVLTHPAQRLRILTVMNCSRFGRSGMPTANGNISRALAALGCTVDHLYVEGSPRPVRVRWLNYLLFGALTARLGRKLEGQREADDGTQVSGGEG